MARKQKTRKKKSAVLEYRRLCPEELFRRIEERRAAGDVRSAIDMAKECLRCEASSKHVELLGGLYLCRARQLVDKDLHIEGLAVVHNALRLGHESQELLHVAFECGLRGGRHELAMEMFRRLQEPALRSRAFRLLVDEAVVQGDGVGRLCEGAAREDALRITRAFAAFERGADEEVTSELKSIGLRSPCAAWKWVLLGLLAYHRQDLAHARSCWDKVGGRERAGRLAAMLRSCLICDKTPQDVTTARVRIELQGELGNPRVAMLESISQALAEGDDKKALTVSGHLLLKVSRQERQVYAQRLGRAMIRDLDWSPEIWKRFQQVFGELPEDPMVLRATAVNIEHESPEDAILFWNDYLERLATVKVIPPGLRDRAKALIWRRMGDVARLEEDRPSWDRFDESYDPETPDAVTCYRKSIRHNPDDLQTHEKLLDVLKQKGFHKGAEKQAQEISRRWPAHIDSLLLLAESCLHRHAFRKALNYFDQAREAEPFNTRINVQARACLLFSARRRLDKGSIELARKDYEQAATLRIPSETDAYLHCKRAALEWRAGDDREAERWYTHAQGVGDDPLVLYYQMVIELRRACAPAKVQNRFDKLLETEWKRDPTGSTAAAVVEVAEQHVALRNHIDRYASIERALRRYLGLTYKKVDLTEEQSLSICRYLDASEDWKLLERIARAEGKRFPENYFFPMFQGRAYLGLGKSPLPKYVIRKLTVAGRQASQAGEKELAGEIAGILAQGGRLRHQGLLEMLDQATSLLGGYDLGDEPFDDTDGVEDDVPTPRPRRDDGAACDDQPRLFEDDTPFDLERP